MDENTRIIEINGVKLEVDLRYAKTIDNYRIGQNVKVLKKEYGDSYISYPGIIVGFDNFKELPTIVIAYVKSGYNPDINFVYLNSNTKEIEIAPMIDDEMPFTKQDALENFDRDISSKEAALADIKAKRQYFLDKFGHIFKNG